MCVTIHPFVLVHSSYDPALAALTSARAHRSYARHSPSTLAFSDPPQHSHFPIPLRLVFFDPPQFLGFFDWALRPQASTLTFFNWALNVRFFQSPSALTFPDPPQLTFFDRALNSRIFRLGPQCSCFLIGPSALVFADPPQCSRFSIGPPTLAFFECTLNSLGC